MALQMCTFCLIILKKCVAVVVTLIIEFSVKCHFYHRQLLCVDSLEIVRIFLRGHEFREKGILEGREGPGRCGLS